MLHSIEDFCKKIQSIADQAKRLKELSQKSDSNAEICLLYTSDAADE